MKNVFFTILAVGLVCMLGGCGERTAAAPSSATAQAVSSGESTGTYRITYRWTMLSNNSVGNDWSKTVTCDGQTIRSGDTVTVGHNAHITIDGIVTEDDDYPDSGRGTVKLTLSDGASKSVCITVREDRGQYTGNTAEWELTCRAERTE